MPLCSARVPVCRAGVPEADAWFLQRHIPCPGFVSPAPDWTALRGNTRPGRESVPPDGSGKGHEEAVEAVKQARSDASRIEAMLASPAHKSLTSEAVRKLATEARSRMRLGKGSYRREHVQAFVQPVEVADDAMRGSGSLSQS